ncbi:MAG: hypothetical protein NUV88_03295 [Candidatus Kaiserbacteria bacterium]|nr:hypothetical protein [Candidatus Kaiserbacteria bacterium]
MAERLKHILAQKSGPRSFKDTEKILMHKITIARADLKNARKELKRLEAMHRSNKRDVASPDTNKRIDRLDDILEPTFQNLDVAKKRYEVLKLTEEVSRLEGELHIVSSML